jgi:hypothetical protein
VKETETNKNTMGINKDSKTNEEEERGKIRTVKLRKADVDKERKLKKRIEMCGRKTDK